MFIKLNFIDKEPRTRVGEWVYTDPLWASWSIKKGPFLSVLVLDKTPGSHFMPKRAHRRTGPCAWDQI